MRIWQPFRKTLERKAKIFAHFLKSGKKNIFFFKKTITHIVLMATGIGILPTLREMIEQKFDIS